MGWAGSMNGEREREELYLLGENLEGLVRYRKEYDIKKGYSKKRVGGVDGIVLAQDRDK